MKLHYFLGALILANIGNLAIISTSFASESPETSSLATIKKPSREEIAAAIAKVQNIGDYKILFSATAQPLRSDVKFYQEYNYLLGLATTAENLLADYDNASAPDLEMIITAANDAEIACNLLFGTNRQTKTTTTKAATIATTTEAPTAAPAPTPTNTTPKTQPGLISKTTAEPTTSTSDNTNTDNTSTSGTLTIAVNVLGPTTTPEVTNTDNANDLIAEPTTTTNTDAPAALAHTATATVTGCALGTLYLKERRTYRPGRR